MINQSVFRGQHLETMIWHFDLVRHGHMVLKKQYYHFFNILKSLFWGLQTLWNLEVGYEVFGLPDVNLQTTWGSIFPCFLNFQMSPIFGHVCYMFLRKENVVTKILRVAVGLAESGHAARRLRADDFSVPGGRGTAGLSEALRGGDLGSWDASLGRVLQMVSRV